jgi:putative ABC transport system permease protein
VLALILRSCLSLVGTGLAAGVVGALALSPLISTVLVGVSPRDAATYVMLPALMLLVIVIASVIPAARATRIEPVTALRRE